MPTHDYISETFQPLLTAQELSENIDGCIKNNRESQKTLYSSFYGYAMSICDRYSGNYDDAVEILNDGFLKIFKEIHKKLKSNAVKYGVKEINGFYMSVLEHEWFILVQSNNAHDIEQLCIESGISSFNTVKIVPLTDYQDVLNRINQNQ